MSILGEDERGFELARKLESHGVWRAWLGEQLYTNSKFSQLLSSASAWSSFLKCDDSKSRADILLQLRARALLFDKAALPLLMSFSCTSSAAAVAKLNPNYLQLHSDDVYYTLEDADHRSDGSKPSNSKSYSKPSFGAGARQSDEFPDTWYTQFIDNAKVNNLYRLLLSDREFDKRSPEDMASYLEAVRNHKRRRTAFKYGHGNSSQEMHSGASLDDSSATNDDAPFFPETMYTSNCVPDCALPPVRRKGLETKDVRGVLDCIPHVKNRAMIERLGISPDQLSRGKNWTSGGKKALSQEQASRVSQKVVARLLAQAGFESSTEVPLEVFSQFMQCHFSKLGRVLKILSDSYRSQCSAVELIKMFLQAAGYNEVAALIEVAREGIKTNAQQQFYEMQSQNQSPSIRVQQQISRQMPQMGHSQSMAFQQQQQQQLERMRRRQAASPRAAMEVEKERTAVQVKLENTEMPVDSSAFNLLQARQSQMQLRQQQLAVLSSIQSQAANHSRPMGSPQLPQSVGMVRAPPVKVEGFQELMGGDALAKSDVDDKLTSPLSR